ncbi:helix-turn-helix domain-containing protein [Streptomyces sp. NPDC002884]|uniref:helix-turn-helix domain-containing protein n=1 Tax=Streptomyces sp. NPDC002884 TaxID=3154544 RepID=UPI0033211296
MVGSLTAGRRAAREGIRLEAGRRFARGDRTSDIAKNLRVSERSVENWRCNWREGGMEALKSKGPETAEAVGRTVCPAGEGAGQRTGRAWLGRSTVDAGTRRNADRPPVPDQLPDHRSVAAAAPPRLVLAEPCPSRT